MSTRTQAILDQVKALPDDERREVCEQIVEFESRMEGWEKQKAILRDMQSRHAGSGLLEVLLEERRKDRERER